MTNTCESLRDLKQLRIARPPRPKVDDGSKLQSKKGRPRPTNGWSTTIPALPLQGYPEPRCHWYIWSLVEPSDLMELQLAASSDSCNEVDPQYVYIINNYMHIYIYVWPWYVTVLHWTTKPKLRWRIWASRCGTYPCLSPSLCFFGLHPSQRSFLVFSFFPLRRGADGFIFVLSTVCYWNSETMILILKFGPRAQRTLTCWLAWPLQDLNSHMTQLITE